MLKKLTQKSTKMNKETKRKRRENFKYDEKIDIVKKHYFECASLKNWHGFIIRNPLLLQELLVPLLKKRIQI